LLRIHGRGLRIGVLVRDPALARRVVEAARSHGFKPVWVLSPEELPLGTEVVIHEGPVGLPPVLSGVSVRKEDDPEKALLRALYIVASRRPGRLEVAIDPGSRSGAVFVKGGMILCSGVFNGNAELLDAVRSVSGSIGEDPKVFYVGSTSNGSAAELVDLLRSYFPGSKVVMVPEGPMRDLRVPEDLKGDELDAYFIYLRAVSSRA
jgi:hypothetical protein